MRLIASNNTQFCAFLWFMEGWLLVNPVWMECKFTHCDALCDYTFIAICKNAVKYIMEPRVRGLVGRGWVLAQESQKFHLQPGIRDIVIQILARVVLLQYNLFKGDQSVFKKRE